jgi:putative flippase GtrA
MDLRFWFNTSIRSEKVRFILVGGYNTLFGYGLFAGLILLAGSKIHYLIILLLAHLIGVTNAYYTHGLLVFRDAERSIRSYLRFHSVYLASLGFSLVALPILVEIVHLGPILAQGVVIVITVIMSYILHKHFSFAK